MLPALFKCKYIRPIINYKFLMRDYTFYVTFIDSNLFVVYSSDIYYERI